MMNSFEKGNSGIYVWYCKKSKKRYVGRSINLKSRYSKFVNLETYYYAGDVINKARQKYNNIDDWVYDIVAYENDDEKLKELEKFYIEKYNTLDRHFGYNQVFGDLEVDYMRQKIELFIQNWQPLLQYDLQGNFIDIYETYDDFNQTSFNINNVLHCCLYKGKTAENYMWRVKDYDGEIVQKVEPYGRKLKRVYEYDSDGNLIEIHDSVNIAAKKYNFNIDTLRCGSIERGFRYGRLWIYEEDAQDTELVKRLIEEHNKPYQEKIRKYLSNTGYQILQYDLSTGNYIRSWDTIKDAQDTLGLHNISVACYSDSKTDGGFIWKFKTTEEIPLKVNTETYFYGNNCYRISIDTLEILEEYKSAAEAERLTKDTDKFSFGPICECLRGEILYYRGFIWVLKEEYSKEKVLEIKRKIREKELRLYGPSVYQIDINTDEIIKVWKSATEAECQIGNKSKSKGIIRSCCLGKSKTAYGYKWKFNEEEYKIAEELKKNFVRTDLPKNEKKESQYILQYSSDGVFMREFDRLKDAENATGLNNIGTACKKKKMDGGYIWLYKENDEIKLYINTDDYISKTAIYKVSLSTGNVLESFKSINEIKKKYPDINFRKVSTSTKEHTEYMGYLWILKSEYNKVNLDIIIKKNPDVESNSLF